MSLSVLLDKYDVSTEEGLQKALNEIEKEESEVNVALSSAVSRACSLEGRLRSASQAFGRLGEVRSDAHIAADMVDRTAELARDVSAKVRQLDLARSRVAECQRRVHDLIDLRLCSAGVETAIKTHDLETAANHVARFLSMDPGSVRAAAAKERAGEGGATDPTREMAKAAETLREHLVRKLEEAARASDSVAVERVFRLFPLIGRADEGVELFAKFLASQTESAIRRAGVVSECCSDGAVFADALTRVLEASGAAVERARARAAGCAPGRLHMALRHIQPVVCSGAGRVVCALVSARCLQAVLAAGAAATAAGAAAAGGPASAAPAGPLATEPAAAELALAHSRIRLYFGFVRRKAEMDAAPVENEEARKQSVEAVERILSQCELMRAAQDVLGNYLAVERYFLEESVNKALKMAAPAAGATSSSLVDDVFYIARKVIRRAISSGSVDGACAVLNEAAAALERDVAAALRRWVSSAPPEPLPFPPPGLPGGRPAEGGAVLSRINREVDAQRLLFLAHMVEAESGAEWSERLAAEACSEGQAIVRSEPERDKLESCAAGLGAAAAAFRAAHGRALAGVAAALKPRVYAWAEAIAEPGGDPDAVEDDADALPSALECLSQAWLALGLGRAHDAVLAGLVTDIAARVENRILANRYDREGGLLVERRVRRLAAWAGGAAGAARERCARLGQAAQLLAIERVAHARDALLPQPRLGPTEVRDILARRMDFKMEDIKRLKL